MRFLSKEKTLFFKILRRKNWRKEKVYIDIVSFLSWSIASKWNEKWMIYPRTQCFSLLESHNIDVKIFNIEQWDSFSLIPYKEISFRIQDLFRLILLKILCIWVQQMSFVLRIDGMTYDYVATSSNQLWTNFQKNTLTEILCQNKWI